MTPKEARKKFQGKYFMENIITDVMTYLYVQKVDIYRSNPDRVYLYVDYFYYNRLKKECVARQSVIWTPHYDILDRYYVRIPKNEYYNLSGERNGSEGNKEEDSR